MLEENKFLTRVFACGVGYPVRTKDDSGCKLSPSKNSRADSFKLYMNVVGDIILKNILPKAKLGFLTSHIEDISDPWLANATYE